ncbi:MAG: hypothetical protein PUD09_00565 [Coriobacteriales bacterium]|nr:hypothetical protein [Coriobacteriales bacterium]
MWNPDLHLAKKRNSYRRLRQASVRESAAGVDEEEGLDWLELLTG